LEVDSKVEREPEIIATKVLETSYTASLLVVEAWHQMATGKAAIAPAELGRFV